MAAVACVNAAQNDLDSDIYTLEDSMSLMDTGGSCDTAISEAKVACQEKLALYKKMQASNCMQKEMAAVMSRIKRNTELTVKQQAKLKQAQARLRKLQYGEGEAAQTAASAREKLLKALVKQIHQKNGLKSHAQKAIDELKDVKSTRYKANYATGEAVKYAETKCEIDSSMTSKAKSLYTKMIDEKVTAGREKCIANKGKKDGKVTAAMIKKLFTTAKELQAKKIKNLKLESKASKTVAKQNTKLTKDETKTAKLQKKASKKEAADFKKKAQKEHKIVVKDQKSLKAAKVKLEAAQKDASSATKEVHKVQTMDLKALLAQAGNLLKP
jgi:hypothetical protein